MLEDRIRGRSDRGDEIDREDWGWIEVDAMRLSGAGWRRRSSWTTAASVSPDDGNPDDRTVLVVPLPARGRARARRSSSRSTGGRKIPRTFARTGFRGDFYFIAHWFPKLGVFEADGWNCHQFHAATEFYSDYGVYDVAMTVPDRLRPRRHRPRGRAGGTTATARPPTATGRRDVHAFTWTTSPDYLEAQADASRPPACRRSTCGCSSSRSTPARRTATSTPPGRRWSYYGSWYGPYPYGHVTVVDPAWGSGAGGMEYPTLFTCGTRLFNPLRRRLARGGDDPRGRAPVLVRPGRQQRVRARLDRRGPQHVLDRSRPARALRRELLRQALLPAARHRVAAASCR